MNNKLQFQLLLYPIILIVLSSLIITTYHVYQFIKNEQNDINELTRKYITDEKKKIYDHVHYVKEKIIMYEKTVEKNLKEEIKNKVEFTLSSMISLYKKYKTESEEKDIKNMLITYLNSIPFKDKDGYFFCIRFNR